MARSKMTLLLLFCAISACFYTPLFAEEEMPAGVSEKIEGFFAKIQENNPTEALEGIFADTSMAAEKKQDFYVAISQLQALLSLCGSFRSKDMIDVNYRGKFIMRVRYLVNFDRLPARFEFIFWNSGAGWRIFNIVYDSAPQMLFY